MLKAVAAAVLICLTSACAAPAPGGPRAPMQIRTGVVESAIQGVETDVSQDEVAEAVRAMVAEAPICAAWPTLWLEQASRRTLFIARYDLMRRDWGGDVADASYARMEEFVMLGYLTKRPRDDLGPGATEYDLTAEGRTAMRGSPYSGERPNFCAPAQRRLIEITDMQWGRFACGNLQVRFTHVSDDWPTWARDEVTRERLAQTWPAIGEPAQGSVTLSRQWSSERGGPNGALRSVCYDASRERIIGDDLQLFSGAR